jgi:predicted secreted protein
MQRSSRTRIAAALCVAGLVAGTLGSSLVGAGAQTPAPVPGEPVGAPPTQVDPAAPETSTTTTAADGGEVITAAGPIELSVDGRATIRLDANPTTGYQWEPVAAPDESVIRVVSDHYRADDSNVVGSGGTQEIVLVKHTGCGMLTFTNEDAYGIVEKNLGYVSSLVGSGMFDFVEYLSPD